MALSTSSYKGARDFFPEDERIQNYIFGIWREIAQSYGYEQYDASIIEPIELYLAKSSQEIVNEQTYSFTDRGGREVTLRPEMTPTVSRMIAAKRQELAYPVRWFSTPNVWRYERPQKGRLREHWQLNVDLFGVDGIAGDHELISIADALMRRFGAKRSQYSIRINSRQLINYILSDYLQLDVAEALTVVRLIDRMHKIDRIEFEALVSASVSPSQRDDGVDGKLLQLLQAKTLKDLPTDMQVHPAALRLLQLEELLAATGMTNASFDITLMRGFDYYTDIVFEVYDTDPANSRSLFGGGRYDGLVGLFGVEPVPTVGFGMGDVTIRDFLETHDLLPALESSVDAWVVLAGDVYTAVQSVVSMMREEGVHLAIDSTGRKLDKQLKSASKAGVRFAMIVGEAELADGRFTLRNLRDGTEQKHSAERLVQLLLQARAVEKVDPI